MLRSILRERRNFLFYLFCFALVFSSVYYVAWWIWRWSDAPAFLFLIGSFPWSLILWETLNEIGRAASWDILSAIVVLVLCLGFSFNIVVTYILISWLGLRSAKNRSANNDD